MSLKIQLLMILATIMTSSSGRERKKESSAEYLEKAMLELQELNAPTPTVLGQSLKKSYMVGHHGSTEGRLKDEHAGGSSNVYQISPAHYERKPTRGQTMVADLPVNLAMSRAELAAFYKNALERGSPMSLSALMNGLTSGKLPRVTATSLQLSPLHDSSAQHTPMYQYYFFPLKSFASELQKVHGYKTIPSASNEVSSGANKSHELSNPLFLAVSSFVGMALLFMMGILFLPKLGQFANINGRTSREDFILGLMNNVQGALENRDFLNATRK